MAEDGGGGQGAASSPKTSRSSSQDSEEPRNRKSLRDNSDSATRDLELPRHSHIRRKSHELCIITCKGTLGDPAFNKSFRRILSGLNKLLNTGNEITLDQCLLSVSNFFALVMV